MIDALCIFTFVAFCIGAIITRGTDRYNCAGTALLVGLIWLFVQIPA